MLFREYVAVPEHLVAELLYNLRHTTRLAVDTETYYNPLNTKAIIRWIKGNPNNEPFLLTLSDGDMSWAINVNATTLPHIKDFLERDAMEWVLYNAKFDMHMMANLGVNIRGRIWDAMILRHLLDENAEKKGLKDNAIKFLDKEAGYWEGVVDNAREKISKETGRKKDEVSYREVPAEIMVPYACADTFYTMRLFDWWLPQITEQELLAVYANEERSLHTVLRIERRGMKVDLPYVRALKATLEAEVQGYLEELHTFAPHMNPGSANDLVAFYQSVGIDYCYRTEKGEWRTDADTLETYLLKCGNTDAEKFTETLLRYRTEDKILGTFIQGILDYEQQGRIHPEFWLTGTRTGRMSSSNPNFQNIPKGDDRIRRAFIPEDGYIFVYFDYSQQEYKLLAHYSKDAALTHAIMQGWDVHTATGCSFANITMEQWEGLSKGEAKDIRDKGKTGNFAIVYGLGNAALANKLGYPINEPLVKAANKLLQQWNIKPWNKPNLPDLLPKCKMPEDTQAISYYYGEECQASLAAAGAFKKEYFGRFPGIQDVSKQVADTARSRGYVFDWVKRRRRLKRDEAYKALNSLIQGGCGDILKDRLPTADDVLLEKITKTGIVNLVHDEIQLEMHLSELWLIPIIKDILEDLPFRVPINTDCEWSGTNWAEKRPLQELATWL